MKKTHAWHHTPLGGVVLFLGSIQLAVPILALVAVGLGVGTWLESTRDVRVARHYVYGSWWFIGVMALVCLSLVFAVITRYPWKKRHVGFITVHAGLVGLIAAGFWSMFERVDGNLALQEGTVGDVIETADPQVEALEHAGGAFNSLAAVEAPHGPATLSLAGVSVQVLERWENSRDEDTVLDDSPVPLRAVDIAPMGGPQSAWVGQEDQAGPAPTLLGLRVLVLPEGTDWTPPPPPAEGPKGEFVFVIGPMRFTVTDAGQDAFPGWKITEIKRFTRAMVSGESIVEGPASAPENRAVQLKISDGKGTTEQHTAFEQFPDMVMGKTLEGPGNSGARLVPGSARADPETIVVFGTIAKTRIGYIGVDGRARVLDPEMKYPMTLQLGSREVVIASQLARAHQVSRTVQAPVAKDNRPCLLLRVAGGTELKTLAWKDMVELRTPEGRPVMLHFGPRRVQLPFSVHLADFRKTDYPGTEMAMAYQSFVNIERPGAAPEPFEIYMNHPYTSGPWKVYQSGFMGEKLSIFSVMRDPGLPLTYISSIVLCVGVVITFYSRSLSWGHPGIPIRPEDKEPAHATNTPAPAAVPAPAPREAVGGGV